MSSANTLGVPSVLAAAALAFVLLTSAESAAPARLELKKGDRICLLGNALAERMQHDGWLESRLQAQFPNLELTVRNLGFCADELSVHQRVMNFGKLPEDPVKMNLPNRRFVPWDRYLGRCKADVVFAFFGYNESFAGKEGLPKFREDLKAFIDHVRAGKYNGRTPPRLVLFSSIAYEDLDDPSLPDGSEHNARIESYARATAEVAKAENVPFVDLFGPTRGRYASSNGPLTINGIHLNEQGNAAVAEVIERALFGSASTAVPAELRDAVKDKNLHWFKRYRVADGYNVHGGRSQIAYPRGESLPDVPRTTNYEVLQRELERLEVMTENRDRKIRALARGEDLDVADTNLPPEIPVQTNKPGPGPGGTHVYVSGEKALGYMTAAPGMKVNLFADEQRFPQLVNPVQMAWDTGGRLWVAVWPSYPNWKPGEPMQDKLLILEDTDRDGRADVCKEFASDLTNPTGFEFWNGGVLVAQIPDLVFLNDTDGDDRYDRYERLLHGISSGDTHHSANSFVLGPGGALYFQEGTFHMSQIESIHGPMRNQNGCVWRFDPRTWRVERYVPYDFANPHGHVFDRWGQDFVTDGTGNVNYYALPFSGYIEHPSKHGGYFSFYKQRSRPCPATEILSSRNFPPENQGNYLNLNVIGFLGIFQERFVDAGSGFGAVPADNVVSSQDPNFRPTDAEMGPDGALYFIDWHNAIIGHLQHHIRDPNRDRSHGRVYRVSYGGRPLLEPKKIDGEPIEALLELLKEPEDRVRYRARIELSERDSDRVVAAAARWVKALDPKQPDYLHHVLEALWLHQQHDRMNRELLERLLRCDDYRARAAATRVLRYMRHHVGDPLALLEERANDDHPRVRLEAVVAASFFDSFEATSVALEALKKPMDRFLDYAMKETIRALQPRWKDGLRAGRRVAEGNPAGLAYLLERVSGEELVGLPRVPSVLRALLTRHHVGAEHRLAAAKELARRNGSSVAAEIVAALAAVDRGGHPMAAHTVHDLGTLLGQAGDVRSQREKLADLALDAATAAARETCFAALISIDGSAAPAWAVAAESRAGVQAFLGGARMLKDAALRRSLYGRIRPLMFALPVELRDGDPRPGGPPGLTVSFYEPGPADATLAAFGKVSPKKTLHAKNFSDRPPGANPPDAFGLLFRGRIRAPKTGVYVFFTRSDDGSRLFIGDRQVVDNDGRHGVVEKRGRIRLKAGWHPITVTYFDGGGGDELEVLWRGPGFKKQPIPDDALGADPSTSTRAAAIRAMARVPGHAAQKFEDAAKLLGDAALLEPVVEMLRGVPKNEWPRDAVAAVIDTIAANVSGMPAEQRTTPGAVAALDLGRELADALPAPRAGAAREALAGLGGSIVLVRTVPHKMLYDVEELWVEAGKPVALLFQNNDMMPHNLVITRPGALEKVGKAAERLTGGGGDRGRVYIPDLPEVLWHTGLLYPGESQRLTFVAPSRPGDHPFVCTFPGHWTVMNGVMHVVEEIDPARHVVQRSTDVDSVPIRAFVKDWKLADFAGAFADGWAKGVSQTRGRNLFTEAGCIKCHTYAGDGAAAGPDLTAIAKKYQGKELLRHLLDPSAEVLEGYEQHVFETEDGDVIGRIVKDTGAELHVHTNLQDPGAITVLKKNRILDRSKTQGSAMPTGLLVTLTKEEVVELVAFLSAGGG